MDQIAIVIHVPQGDRIGGIVDPALAVVRIPSISIFSRNATPAFTRLIKDSIYLE